MNIVRWNPWNEMAALRSHMNRVFDESFYPAAKRHEDEELALCNWSPVVDVYESEDAYVVSAELPGLSKEDIVLDFKGRVLTLKGERTYTSEVKEDKYYRRERSYGKFQRSFTLPAEINPDNISAEFKDGVLKVSIPKPEEQKPRQIMIH
ncbi:molecular chaperone [Desulfonema ishimotonii]|uniref:Molecular chaperone n=2 Tax=Desulfonema ishimotonii TaxID=45657 RepID=A0A401FYL1_9BACT|nr:molecular chaperone [Desulfonema ishimotonii]